MLHLHICSYFVRYEVEDSKVNICTQGQPSESYAVSYDQHVNQLEWYMHTMNPTHFAPLCVPPCSLLCMPLMVACRTAHFRALKTIVVEIFLQFKQHVIALLASPCHAIMASCHAIMTSCCTSPCACVHIVPCIQFYALAPCVY